MITSPRGKPFLPPEVADLARDYHRHHFTCPVCIASGVQVNDARCARGDELHRQYEQAFNQAGAGPAKKK